MDDEEPDCCPLCMEELDITDKTFDACPCGYQVSQSCAHFLGSQQGGALAHVWRRCDIH